MAQQADVFVRNSFIDDISVIRKLPDGSIDLDITVASGNEDRIYLPVSEVSMIINAPDGVDTEDCYIIVRSGIIDLAILCSSTNWTLRIVPNYLPPDVPTTVNVSVGPAYGE